MNMFICGDQSSCHFMEIALSQRVNKSAGSDNILILDHKFSINYSLVSNVNTGPEFLTIDNCIFYIYKSDSMPYPFLC